LEAALVAAFRWLPKGRTKTKASTLRAETKRRTEGALFFEARGICVAKGTKHQAARCRRRCVRQASPQEKGRRDSADGEKVERPTQGRDVETPYPASWRENGTKKQGMFLAQYRLPNDIQPYGVTLVGRVLMLCAGRAKCESRAFGKNHSGRKARIAIGVTVMAATWDARSG